MDKFIVIAVTFAIISTLVGSTPIHPGTKIIGGSTAPEGAYPYQVSLRYIYSHLCGGSIINPEWVLTAASCVYQIPESSLTAVAGTNSLNYGGTDHSVIATYIHEDYDPKTHDNDIALLRVQHINFNAYTSAITLDFLHTPKNVIASLTGWGYTSSSPGYFPDKLQQTSVVTISNEDCSKKLNKPVWSTEICTVAGSSLCDGDTGGPLVDIVNRKLIGIARAVHTPCGKDLPDVHLRISSYYGWIEDKCGCI